MYCYNVCYTDNINKRNVALNLDTSDYNNGILIGAKRPNSIVFIFLKKKLKVFYWIFYFNIY